MTLALLLVLVGGGPDCEADLKAVRDASRWYAAEKKDQAGPGQGTAPLEPGPAARRVRFVSERFLQNCLEHPEALRVRYRLGRLLYEHNKFEPALAHFDQVISARPGHELAAYAAQLSLDLLNLQRDFVGLERLVRRYRNNEALMRHTQLRDTVEQILPQVIFRCASHDLESAEEPAQIRRAARKFLQLARELPGFDRADHALYNAAIAFDRARDPRNARAARKRLLEFYPKSPLAPRVREQLEGQ